jgi:hypothetical protein
MRMDARIGGGRDFLEYEQIAGVVQALLPVMEKLNIASAIEVNLPTLAQRIQDEVVSSNGVVLSPGIIGAWSRKP